MAGKVSTAKGLFLKFEAAPLWAPLTEHGTEEERFCRAVGHALAPQGHPAEVAVSGGHSP